MGSPEESVPQPTEAPRETEVPLGVKEVSEIQPGDPFWARIRRHKVVEWTLAYVAFGYALLHGVQMLRETFDWPFLVPRLTVFALVLGAPIAVTLAWYHGHRARHRVSGQELSILIALLVVAGSVLWWASRTGGSTHAASTVAADVTHPGPALGEKSIAVLPFVDLSEKHDQEYFADGMAEETLNQLARIPGLKVIGRTSSFQFKGRADDLRQIGATLGAAYVLEGSVRRAGDRVRVTAQLITTTNGTHRWSDTYDRDVSDLLVVQDEIALGLARALQLEVGDSAVTPPRRSPPTPEAYDSYLRGLHARDRYDQEGFEEAVADFRRSLELDPAFVSAAEALAQTLQWTTAWGFLPPKQGSEEARAAATKTISIDQKSAVAHAVLCAVHVQYDFDWSGARRECGDAIRFAPHQPSVLKEASRQHMAVGETREAVYSIEAALAADPLDPNSYDNATLIYLRAGRTAEAERTMRRALSIAPTYAAGHWELGVTLLLQGRADAALAESQKDTYAEANLFGCALAYHALHRDREAETSIHELETQYPDYAFNIAEAYAYQGKSDQALFWLDRALQERDFVLHTVKGDPLLKNLENDPRYKLFLRKMNLPE